jgi:hypothetical protein
MLGVTQLTVKKQSTAWNNLVMNADPSKYHVGDKRRAAAIVSIYMGFTNNGGLNYFLTYSFDLDTHEVLASLEALGAKIAAAEFRTVLDMIGDPLDASTQDARWDQLEDLWTDELDDFDILTEAANQDLLNALTKHVEEYVEYYFQMTKGE